ncbi:TetR/AcrR family transcriptional regulator [Rhodococcus opacus]
MSTTETASPTDSSAPRVGRKKRATRARIVECAIPLFSEYGYDKITMESIAKAAGISRANLYLHFKAKAELVDAMLEQLSPEVVDSYRTLDSLDPADTHRLRGGGGGSSQLWGGRRRRLGTPPHALSARPGGSQRWYQTLSEAADAMTTFLGRYPDGPERQRARLTLVTTMLGFERTLYFVLVRSAPADHSDVIDVLTAQWHAALAGATTPAATHPAATHPG